MGKQFDYRIGIDIGIASVGWSVVQVNSKDEPIHIIDLGVRTFDKPEVPKTGESLTKARREARSARRRINRRRHRITRVKYLLARENVIDVEEFLKRYHKAGLPNVYELRVKALDEAISEEDLAQIMLFFAKHRGFKSNRKADRNSDEGGKVLAAITESRKIFQDGGYRTAGEMIYKDELFHTQCPWNGAVMMLTPRNTSGNYSHTLHRDDLVDEIHQIFAAQRAFGNKCATEKIETEYIDIFSSQRSFDEGPGPMAGGKSNPYAMSGFGNMVGYCTLEPKEKRAPKAAFSAELFVALETINHLRIESRYGEVRFLTQEERGHICAEMYKKKELSYAQIRKLIDMPEDSNFLGIRYKIKKSDLTADELRAKKEKTKCVALKSYHAMSAITGADISNCSLEDLFDLFDAIAVTLTDYKSDNTRREKLRGLNLEENVIEALLELDPSDHINLSLKAVRNLIPHLETGVTYNQACVLAGYDFQAKSDVQKSHLLKGPEVNTIINEIANPVVRRSISQTIKVINAIIVKYGTPQAINVELAREMSKNFQERNEIKNAQDENEARNTRIRKLIQETYHIAEPKGQDILKYRLWEEQDGICPYSGEKIPASDIFTGAYEVDHILPYSRTFNDSFANKVLVKAKENQDKGNRIPFEYFGEDIARWDEFESRVFMIYHGKPKGKRLLKKQLSSEEMSEFKTRNLNDTRYIARVIYNLLNDYLEFAPFNHPEKKRHVVAVNGSITAYLRKRWGLGTKDRRTDLHHAKDAVVIACVTSGNIHKITNYVKGRELQYAFNLKLVDEETGEVFSPKDYTREQWDQMFGTKVPYPWPCFKTELDVRMGSDPLEFMRKHSDIFREIDYPEEILEYVRPIFVSRMTNHKVTGAGHKETISSAKYYETDGVAVSKVALDKLKLVKDKESGEYAIEGYFNPESDKLLYDALLKRLIAFDGKAEKAFAEPFYKPRSDGSRGPLVRKVKVVSKMTSGVLVGKGNGIASNGEMVRVDVFKENGKYYLVPIYTADVVAKTLPNKASKAGKPMSEWKIVNDEEFLFSLYPKDLVCVCKKGGIKVTYIDKNQSLLEEEQFLYFGGMDISTASISGCAHDSSFSYRGLGVQTLLTFEKCQVDVLGCISVVGREKRLSF